MYCMFKWICHENKFLLQLVQPFIIQQKTEVET